MKNIVLILLLAVNIVQAQEWLTDFEEAKESAKEYEKNMMLLFSGSDWCAPCIKLEKQILETQEFKEYANQHYILLKVDFPRKKKNQLPEPLQKQNNDLAEKYNRSGGFPLIVILDKEGKKLGEVGYKKGTPSSYIQLLQTINSK
ncbi:thioredoxin family protein [Aquimarina sp. I32.4]|uniref:thioredoxin family protein n=1 Tax=Aquimarina sp. I32.4 TaxID=2053903 RepID=UPI000CDF0DA7|nr:thioredoxin family protein [Aquimarina sp. I32.4]